MRKTIWIVFTIIFWFSYAEAGSKILHSWDTKIDGTGRFKVLSDFNDEAVLDNETGLVWERSPSPNAQSSWFNAILHCYVRETGGRLGWRLPTIEELVSLADLTRSEPPALPAQNPFSEVSDAFWSITTYTYFSATSGAYSYSFFNIPPVSGFASPLKSSSSVRAWCVRGGHGYDVR